MESDDDDHYAETEYQMDEEEEFARQITNLADEHDTMDNTSLTDEDPSPEQGPAEPSRDVAAEEEVSPSKAQLR